MTDLLDIAGVALIAVAAFTVSITLGFAVGGVCLLGMSWAITKRGRK